MDNEITKEQVKLNAKKMVEIYSKYPRIRDYHIDPDIFKPEIQKLIRFSLENED